MVRMLQFYRYAAHEAANARLDDNVSFEHERKSLRVAGEPAAAGGGALGGSGWSRWNGNT